MSFNLGSLMKQAQKMQQEMQKIQDELAQEEVIGESAGSGVKVVANGQGEVLRVIIPKEVVNPEEVEMLEDLVLMAVRDALKRAKDLMEERMSKLTGGIKLPGLFG